MDSRPRHISPSEWNRWKDTILALRHGKALKDVIALMTDVHGFSASQSQYEIQLNAWENRKNLKKDEWADILMIIDKLDPRYENCRVLISGHPVPAARVQRARRYCVAKLGDAKCRRGAVLKERRSVSFQNVSIETLAADGRWTAYAYLDDIDVSDRSHNQTDNGIHLPISPVVDSGPSGSVIPDAREWQDGYMDDEITASNIDTTFLQSGFLCNADSQVFGVEIVGEETLPSPTTGVLPFSPSMAMIQSPSQWGLSSFGDIDFGSSNWDSTGWIEIPHYQYFSTPMDLLNNLPFKRFREDLEIQAIHQSRSSNVGGVHLASTAQNPVTLFLEDLRSSMSERNKNQDRWPIYMKDVLSSLETLLPDGKLQPVYDSRQSLITEDEIFGTKFNQLLVFSIANNFAGLPDIPVESMLKYWSRGGGMVSLLLQSLQASQSHFAKALAQNLFPAAIEANDERALKHLLSIGSIDVNTTMCIVNGEKYTPVERAAYLQELGIVELLLIAKADVNKTFQEIVKEFYLPRSNLRGALGSFVEGCRTTTSEAFELGKLLLRAGAKVHAEVAKHALEYLCHRDLTYLIVSSISDSDHAECIESQLLTCIAANLSDRQATEVTNKLISACQRTNCGRCLSQFKDYVDSALVQGTRCGHSQLVGLLLRYSTTPHRALSAAIKCGKHELIDTILTLKPDMDAPAHSIREWSSIFGQGRDRKNDDEDDVTTSLAEAIKARDESLILMIEDASSLAHLDEGGRFEPAITAASKTGNTIYVQKLLKHCPSPKPSYMTNAVLHAIQNSDEQIFRILLAAGANVNERDGFGRAGPTLLLAAMVCRNSYMVREILNADIMASDSIESIFKEAIKWGDKSIIEDIRSTFPGIQLEGNELSKALGQGHMEWFELLLSSRMVSGYALTNCLKVALERGDDRLFHDLIKRGANPTGSSILDHCAEKCPKRLPLLLERFPFRASNYIMPGFGTSALIAVIKQGLDGLEAVNILLGCGLIDTESFSFRNDLPLGEAIRVSRNGNHADYAVIRKLLDSGCDPNCFVVRTRNYGPVSNQTAFLEAVGTKSKSLVQLMIDRGADVKRQATMGLKRTPLQRAVEVNSLELVTLLLGAKADPNDKPATRGGGTALQLAAIQGNCNIAAKLLEWGADLSAPPAVVNGRWPLEGAAEHGRLDMIEFLWKNKLAGCDVAGFDEKQCRRAMELAEENGHGACRDLIAELSQASASASVPAVE